MIAETVDDRIRNSRMKNNLNLGAWSVLVNNGLWRPRDFDMLIMQLLDYAIDGKVSRILLSVPSRHGKSTLISRNLASYFLAHYPNDKVILSAYSQGLASEFGGQVKDIINYYNHLSPYPIHLATDSRAKNKFNIAPPYRGQMLAVGAAGSIMGFGAGLFIVDDPIKNVADADSEVKQQKLREWFGGVVRSRLERRTNGRPPIIIVIAQRLHVNDLHGIIKSTSPTIPAVDAFDILKKGGTIAQDTWVDLNIPAICTEPETDLLGRKKGEVLWPYQRDYDWLMSEKRDIGSYLFNAIYQGHPIEREGNIFKRAWFMDETTNKIYNVIEREEVPYDAPKLRYWDFGASGKKGDATAGMLTAWTGEDLIMIDLVTGKFTANQVLRKFQQTAKRDGKDVLIRIEQEPGSASKLLINKFRRSKEFKGFNIRGDKVKLKKNVRSFDLEALAEDGRIWFVHGDWNIEVIDHLVAFTGQEGKPDDIADACTGSARHWRRPKRNVKIY
ncbi:terminase large subunit [Methanobrevibacter sp.]|uniref:phage terminase large subunit family protein n=1 Tax=Methanobrevibacter sp. TaxID=66852 RepID=UPI003866D9A8